MPVVSGLKLEVNAYGPRDPSAQGVGAVPRSPIQLRMPVVLLFVCRCDLGPEVSRPSGESHKERGDTTSRSVEQMSF